MPYTGTFILKTKGDVGSIRLLKATGYGGTAIRYPTGSFSKDSWYEPGRTIGITVNLSTIINPD